MLTFIHESTSEAIEISMKSYSCWLNQYTINLSWSFIKTRYPPVKVWGLRSKLTEDYGRDLNLDS